MDEPSLLRLPLLRRADRQGGPGLRWAGRRPGRTAPPTPTRRCVQRLASLHGVAAAGVGRAGALAALPVHADPRPRLRARAGARPSGGRRRARVGPRLQVRARRSAGSWPTWRRRGRRPPTSRPSASTARVSPTRTSSQLDGLSRRAWCLDRERWQTRGMAIDLRAQWFRDLAELRYATTPKRLRAALDGETVLDTRDALLVWEPRRVVPFYAVPRATWTSSSTEHEPGPATGLPGPGARAAPPGTHDSPASPPPRRPRRGRVPSRRPGPGRPRGHALGAVRLERGGRAVVVSHPHDPFKRIDVLRSARHVRVSVGVTVAESTRPMMLIETGLPVRWYLPVDDVRPTCSRRPRPTPSAPTRAPRRTSRRTARPTSRGTTPTRSTTRSGRGPVQLLAGATVYVDGEPVPTGMPGA